MTMELKNVKDFEVILPINDEDATMLLATMSQLKGIKKKIDDSKEEYIKLEKEIETVLKDYLKDSYEREEGYSLKTDFGNLSSKKASEKWVYTDEEALINQLKMIDPSLIRIKEEINKVALKKACEVDPVEGMIMHKDSMEDLDGVKVEFGKINFGVTIK